MAGDVLGDERLEQVAISPSASAIRYGLGDCLRDLGQAVVAAETLAVAAVVVVVVGLLGLTTGGAVARLADTFAALMADGPDAVDPMVIERAVTVTHLLLAGLTGGLALGSLYRGQGRAPSWCRALAGAAVILAMVLVAVSLFSFTAPANAGFTQ